METVLDYPEPVQDHQHESVCWVQEVQAVVMVLDHPRYLNVPMHFSYGVYQNYHLQGDEIHPTLNATLVNQKPFNNPLYLLQRF